MSGSGEILRYANELALISSKTAKKNTNRILGSQKRSIAKLKHNFLCSGQVYDIYDISGTNIMHIFLWSPRQKWKLGIDRQSGWGGGRGRARLPPHIPPHPWPSFPQADSMQKGYIKGKCHFLRLIHMFQKSVHISFFPEGLILTWVRTGSLYVACLIASIAWVSLSQLNSNMTFPAMTLAK